MPSPTVEQRFYNIAQLAQYFGKTRRWVEIRMNDYFIKNGLKPRKIGKSKVYDITEVIRIVDKPA